MIKRKSHAVLVVSSILLVLAVSSTDAAGGKLIPPTGGEGEIKTVRLVHAYTMFGFDLYAKVLVEHALQNVFISPASVAIALAMTMGGANGTTEEAMAHVMKLVGMEASEINGENKALIDRLGAAYHGIEVSTANSLWLRPDFPFHRDFIEKSTTFFSADVFNELDAEKINEWVSEKTREKIRNIVEEIRPDDIAYLVNAIYFKGIWTREFDPEKTTDEDFHLIDGSTVSVPMMNQSGEYRYLEDEAMQAIALPYGEGAVTMYVFLPKPGLELAAFHSRLNGETWETVIKGFTPCEGRIALPRFRCEFTTGLVDALAALGMGVAFSAGEADFSRMCDLSRGNVAIGSVIHKAFVEVNEEGTEAAAATAVGMRLTSIQKLPEPFVMTVDRPFYFAIRDEQSGTVLFMGSIYDPSSEE